MFREISFNLHIILGIIKSWLHCIKTIIKGVSDYITTYSDER